jgi:iduronate 2-sulfatase
LANRPVSGSDVRSFPGLTRQSAKHPNVLFISVDDLRPELGCLGEPVIKTPHIDRLAARGTIFSRAYCSMSMCNPSRASLLTGLRTLTLNIYDQETHFRKVRPGAVTLPQLFKNNGYETVAVGKIFHYSLPDPPSWSRPEPQIPLFYEYMDAETRKRLMARRQAARSIGRSDAFIASYVRGPATECFDAPDTLYRDGAIANAAVGLLRELRGKQPFFLGVGFFAPHLPFVTPKKYWDLYDRDGIPMAPNYYLPKGAPLFAMNPLTELNCHEDFVAAPNPTEALLPVAQARLLKHGYYACVSFVDAQIGRILDVLTALGLRDNTIVVLFGDSGWKLGEHGGWCKFTNYEVDTRTALVFVASGQERPGGCANGLVELVDIYPTVVELAGLAPPPGLEGASLVPIMRQPERPAKSAAFSRFPRGFTNRFMGQAMRTERYRYIEWRDWLDDTLIATELYDHETDPGENANIAGAPENASLVRALAVQLKAGWQAALPK